MNAVQVHDATGNWRKNVCAAVTLVPLELRVALGFRSFCRAAVKFDWRLSEYLFRLPSVEGFLFVYPAPRGMLKWTALSRPVLWPPMSGSWAPSETFFHLKKSQTVLTVSLCSRCQPVEH